MRSGHPGRRGAVAPALRTLVSGTGRLLGPPGVDRLTLEAGLRYWRRTVEGLAGQEACPELPARVVHG